MQKIESLRQDVLTLTNTIIESLLERKSHVSCIQDLKEKAEGFKNFDPSREIIVFKNINGIDKLSLKEILSLSLVIEDHASSGEFYPEWSAGVHLASNPTDISHQINPILLASTFKTRYDSLPLNLEFKTLLDKYLG
jgi:chorismate mutase